MMGCSTLDPGMQQFENSAADGVISPGWWAPLEAAQHDQNVQVDERPGSSWPVSSPTVQGSRAPGLPDSHVSHVQPGILSTA